MAIISEEFRKAPDAVPTYDYYDSILGAGVLKLYMATGVENSTDKFFLTTDSSLVSDSTNFAQTNPTDIDFDIEIERPFIIAAKEAIINWKQQTNTGGTNQATWTIYHVDSGNTETSLGSVVGGNMSAGSSIHHKKVSKVTLTRKAFKKGEKLRLNMTAVGSGQYMFDPSGKNTATDTLSRTINSQSFILIPLVVPI